MKNKFTLVFLLLSSVFAHSQSLTEKRKIVEGTNVAELNRISSVYSDLFAKQKAEAFAAAKQYGWKTFSEKKNGQIKELIRLDESGNPVYFITDNAGAAITTRANRLNSGGSLGLNLDGQEMRIGIWDGGKVRDTHVLFNGRVIISDSAPTYSAHPTHVAGTMIGGTTGNPNAKGMAPLANLLAYDWSNDVSEVSAAAANGLLLSNHSYGYDPDGVSIAKWGKYDSDSRVFDNIMFNAPYYLFVNSAGNSRNGGYNSGKNGYDLLAGKSVSKNSIVVAAVGQVNNYVSPESVVMSSFSSWGPTDDGRIKPDISGKGVNLLSSVATGNTSYGRMSGTSMASPNVAGTLLLLQQHYKNVKGNFMKSATLRGLAIHTADEAGTTDGPDYRFGWGLLNAEKAANVITNEGVQSYIYERTLAQGETYSFNIDPLNANQPVVATICWTDPAGQVVSSTAVDLATPNLVNDLDIRITKGTETNFPWKLNPGDVASGATRGDNVVDNVEKIEIPNPTGKYTITVSHKGTLANNLQNYSLIISGIATNPLMLTSTHALTNRICLGTNTTSYDFQLTTIDAFNENAAFTVTGLPAGATAEFTPASLTTSGSSTLNVSNLSGAAAGIYPLTLRAQSPNFNNELVLNLIVQNPIAAAPALTTPANNAAANTNPTLVWENLQNNATNYTIEVSKDSNFASGVTTLTSATNQVPVFGLDFGSNYFWRVKANNLCGSSDYSATFMFTTPCSNATAITITDVTYQSITATWTNPNAAGSFEVLILPSGQTPSGPYTTVTDTSYTFTGLNSYTSYDVYVRSSCSNNTWSELAEKQTATLINHCVDGIFFDSGGPQANYSDGEYITTVIHPMNAGDKASVTFTSFELEDQIDRLYIYNGPDATYPFIGADQYGFTGTNNPGTVTSTDVSGKLTFVFYSDGANNAPGWNATVSCSALSTSGFNKNSFVYYPNPAKNIVNFSAKETIKSIGIYNMLGQLVKNVAVDANQTAVDIAELSTGQYLFKVETQSTVNTVKILKKN